MFTPYEYAWGLLIVGLMLMLVVFSYEITCALMSIKKYLMPTEKLTIDEASYQTMFRGYNASNQEPRYGNIIDKIRSAEQSNMDDIVLNKQQIEYDAARGISFV
jgi:hypothetical protein